MHEMKEENMDKESVHKISPENKDVPFVALSLALTVALSFILASAGMMAGQPVGPWVFPVAVVASWLLSGYVLRIADAGRMCRFAGITAGVIGGSLLIGYLTFDYSFDGPVYHQEIVSLLLDGWNPFSILFSTPENGGEYGEACGFSPSLWALHYAKGIEIVQATVAAFTGNLESAKSVNFIMAASATCAVYDFLRVRFSALGVRARLVITAAVMANPVVWAQILTFYIDFYKYIYLLLFIAGAVEMSSDDGVRRRYATLLLSVAVVMSVATKFNFFFECGLWGVAALSLTFFSGHRHLCGRLAIVGSISFAVAILLTLHPYLTNFRIGGHPLYPLMGEGAVDIMSGITTEMFQGHGRVMNFFRALLIPSLSISCDQRNGGFSPLMPLILLLTVVLAWRLRSRIPSLTWWIALFTGASCFLFPQTWWTRYICQLWALPAIFLPYALLAGSSSRLLGRINVFLMILAGVYSAGWALKQEYAVGSYYYSLLREARRSPVTVISPVAPQYRHQLDDAGVSYSIVEDADIPSLHADPDVRLLYLSDTRRPLMIVSVTQAEAVEASLRRLHLNYRRHEYSPGDEAGWFEVEKPGVLLGQK